MKKSPLQLGWAGAIQYEAQLRRVRLRLVKQFAGQMELEPMEFEDQDVPKITDSIR